jgi:hypothetical protein
LCVQAHEQRICPRTYLTNLSIHNQEKLDIM